MKVSLAWLQNYFDTPLPSAEVVADAYTFHAFEIEEVRGDLIDVKVLPNRAADCLCHRGLARELAAILDLPVKDDPLRVPTPNRDIVSPYLKVEIEDPKKCLRYMGAVVKGVRVGPSPEWLRSALESVGQRSINNVVDATNYVMLNIGQPLHAFDAAKLVEKDGAYTIGVRSAREGEKIVTLSGEEYTLTPNISLITDANADAPIALAGLKGGRAAELTSETVDIVVEAANFDGTSVRRAAQSLKLFTDASLRFQNRPHPKLVAYGMRDVLALIQQIAGGEVVAQVDEYPAQLQAARASTTVSLAQIQGVLGTDVSLETVERVFARLGLPVQVAGEMFTATPPFERTDLSLPIDLIEEVGRIVGYDTIAPTELPPLATALDQARYRGIERMKDQLVAEGYVEVSTQSFAASGDVLLANPLDTKMPALRTTLADNLASALTRAKYAAPLVFAPKQAVKLFEVGTVFPKEGEYLELRMTEKVPSWGDAASDVDNLSIAKLEDYGRDYEPVRYELSAYRPFSLYPFIARDISMWVVDTDDARGIVFKIFAEEGKELLQQVQLVDQFTNKEGRQSLAFRLIFQSFERTLTDDEVNAVMDRIAASVTTQGYEVR